MKKIINLIFNRFYKYYGEDTGLLYSTTMLAGITCLTAAGIYVISYSVVRSDHNPLFFLDKSKDSLRFRLIWGPLVVIIVQQIFYRLYKHNNFYKNVNHYYDANRPTGFFSRNAHYVSFICCILFLLLSFFIGDYITQLVFD
ncbi:hypothetical protein ACVW2L_004141 [Mucilaginibacter sp. HD30]